MRQGRSRSDLGYYQMDLEKCRNKYQLDCSKNKYSVGFTEIEKITPDAELECN